MIKSSKNNLPKNNLPKNNLIDSFHRPVNYLRISVTDRCNLRCRYCAPSMPKPLKKDNILSFEEMYRLVRTGVKLGITKVRLTGGEPLFRKGITDFIKRLHNLPGIDDISLTSNGTLVADKVKSLKQAGLKRINISLDTLDRNKFRHLTGADLFPQVFKGIMLAYEAGFSPVKINMVVMKGFNDNEIEKLAELALNFPFHIRFIEYMPIGTDPFLAEKFFLPVSEIKKRLSSLGTLIPVSSEKTDGPAERYCIGNSPGELGFIGSMSTHFCSTCNRIRLTAGGYLRPCLLSEEQVDIMTPLRNRAKDYDIQALFIRALSKKRDKHKLNFSGNQVLPTKMVSIGG
ncbi:GTP 3',8-cyclase MoaA [Desulfobacterales bacterium HSG17]|nr:GTP 3',8-cyclase MoaA [Desulfobacterales bacterium HSG17]